MIDLEISQYTLEHDEYAGIDVTLDLVRGMYGTKKWAIREHGCVLNKSGKWEREPMPSSRTDAWIKSARWDSAEEALTFWRNGKYKSRIKKIGQSDT